MDFFFLPREQVGLVKAQTFLYDILTLPSERRLS